MLWHYHFINIAKKYNRKIFIIDRTVNKRVTYRQALIASLILSERFNRYQPGFLGIMLPTSAACALSILAALMSGRTPVMINYTAGAENNAKFAKEKCHFKTIITSRSLLKKIDCGLVEGMVFIEDIMDSITSIDRIKAALKSKCPTSFIQKSIHGGDEHDTLLILFTTGSEKEPKAVELTHCNIASNVKDLINIYSLSEHDIFLANLPYFHVFGQTANLWIPIYYGMTIVTYHNPVDYKMICKIIREEGPSLMVGTPSFYLGYLRKSDPGDFEGVRLAVCGADKCPDSLRKGFWDKHQLRLFEAYGTTETSPAISANTPKCDKPGSVGKVLPGVQVQIINYETGQECKLGEKGKIMVKGDLVMKGYLDDLEETSLRIRNSGWYDTGDMGFMDEEGYLWHVGRLKRFVKIGGEMVSLTSVEDVLERLLPEDVSSCVVELPDALKGAKIVAAVTKKIDEKGILKQMADHLPRIALPKKFVVVDDFPRMGSGKINFRAVTEMIGRAEGN